MDQGLAVLLLALPAGDGLGAFPPIVNTQNPKDHPPTPQQAVAKMRLPPGFRATLFAGEPDVRQPIAMCLDDRGRLWVAESYTYADDRPRGQRWDPKFRDRLLIFEDTDNDGRFDRRKVFWDRGRNLSSVLTGFGGVWVLCAPQLLFIPDRDRDDVPDGPPVVILDGWVVRGVGHNIVNGLMWGPDGWLYGRHGIQNTSLVGPPGSGKDERTRLNCCIWRYHPVTKKFEVVCQGTTNPWGLDYDDYGQMFFTNNVNGHLWHVIPGAYYKRMYGEHFNPYVYELIDQHADHHHWDASKPWSASRDAKGKHDALGGGHSHCGGMIYLGDNWPEKYRNTIFMCNTHGRRINNDFIVRKGCGFVARHRRDFMHAGQPWFRGVTLLYGPDGGVFLSDWCDLGECHDHDGVHRTSGRIYKITYGKAEKPEIRDVATLDASALIDLQEHRNDWYVRTARRILQERAIRGKPMTTVHAELRKRYRTATKIDRKLRYLWCLYVTGGASVDWLVEQIGDSNEHVRLWALKLLFDGGSGPDAVVSRLPELAKRESSGLVRLTLASLLQRIPVDRRLVLAAALAARAEDRHDHNQPLMIWYGIEPALAEHPDSVATFLAGCRMPRLFRLAARRMAEMIDSRPQALSAVLRSVETKTPEYHEAVLEGMATALRGRLKVREPDYWRKWRSLVAKRATPKSRSYLNQLNVLFGDGQTIEQLRKVAEDRDAPPAARRAALKVLIDNRVPNLRQLLLRLIRERETMVEAIRGLGRFDDPQIPRIIVSRYLFLQPDDRPVAIAALASRPSFAEVLLEAIENDQIDRADLPAYYARQIVGFGRKDLSEKLTKVWGEVRATSSEKRKLIANYRKLLTPENLSKANLTRGRLLFKKHCAVCHRLFGEGKVIGPDLTGSNRRNLDYLLQNIVDPSAVVPADFTMSVLALKDGRIINGVVLRRTERVLTIKTPTDELNVPRENIEAIHQSKMSLMPEGLLKQLEPGEVRDLFAYLMVERPPRIAARNDRE